MSALLVDVDCQHFGECCPCYGVSSSPDSDLQIVAVTLLSRITPSVSFLRVSERMSRVEAPGPIGWNQHMLYLDVCDRQVV